MLAVFAKALEGGVRPYLAAISEREAIEALRLTAFTAAIVVPANLAFGLAAGWTLGKFDFPGKLVLTALIELPLAVSPVISGLVFVLSLGPRSVAGHWLLDHGVRVIFAWPGIVLATVFVTFPFVARELIPLMQSQGSEEEEASIVLGATAWQMFRHISLPLVWPHIVVALVIRTIDALKAFDTIYVITLGGPGTASETLNILLYQTALGPHHSQITTSAQREISSLAASSCSPSDGQWSRRSSSPGCWRR